MNLQGFRSPTYSWDPSSIAHGELHTPREDQRWSYSQPEAEALPLKVKGKLSPVRELKTPKQKKQVGFPDRY